GGACAGGDNANWSCITDAECPGGTCVPPHAVLTVGKQRDGRIPVIVKASSVALFGIPVSGNACGCIRSPAAKTCGGVLYEADGVTPAFACTPGFSEGESVCVAAGKPPCTFIHGAGNSASGEIGCDGLDFIDVVSAQDSGGASGTAGPRILTLSGNGGP